MGRTLSLEKIPSETRNSFLALCADRPGLTLDDHVQWFSEQGYKVSRSSVHRYMTTHLVANPDSDSSAEMPVDWSIRLQCLTLAATYMQPHDKDDLIKIADELVTWVKASR